MDLADSGWTITIHDRPLLKAHKQLPRRRDPSLPSNDLRSHYKKTPVRFSNRDFRHAQDVSTTPPNPPETVLAERPPSSIARQEPLEHGRDDSSNAETTILRSGVATPTYQKSPPTPDITPPRPDNLLRSQPVLANVPSISSRAESFKTAREELSSDEEVDSWSPSQMPSRQRWLQSSQAARMADWRIQPSPLVWTDDNQISPTKSIKRKPLPSEAFATFDGSCDAKAEKSGNPNKPAPSVNGIVNTPDNGESLQSVTSHPSPLPTPPHSADAEEPSATPERPLQRGKSLRDRLEESKTVRASDSTEKFARDIGWSHVYKSPEIQNRINSWRLSGVSTTSTVEAIVVDAETTPQRQQQLRHSRKNPSLRSASSPFPTSNRSSPLSNPDSSHRLVHKKGKITNKTRWSIDSETSRTISVSSAMAGPLKPEVIPVAVIPERKSSLPSSENSSRRHSASISLSSAGHRTLMSPDHSRAEAHVSLRKKRPLSASLPVGASFESRGRDRQLRPAAPRRSSSLSAPTSRSNSRANSLSSEHFRLRRLAAEEDLHRTLERMESERSVIQRYRVSHTRKGSSAEAAASDTEPWDALRSPSLYAPFSPPSMESASPGLVEMGEARAVNLFAHNNHSLQIIDQFPLPDSRAPMFLHKSGGRGQLRAEGPSTEKEVALPQLLIDSPLRNPRDPPEPPSLKVIPPTPNDLTPVENNGRQLGLPSPERHRRAGSLSRRFGSLRRPSLSTRHQSESFIKSLSRTLSLRGGRHVRADEPRDANLHPFWRPRGFWDDFTDSDSDRDDYDEDFIVSNSLGVPQRRTIIDGPISLVRHLSDSSRRPRRAGGVTKRSSHGNLSKIRAGKRLKQTPGLARHFPFMRLGDLRDRLQLSNRPNEAEKRERTRRELREKIGPQIISTGDSRYPAYMP
jgi:hypothetical protein